MKTNKVIIICASLQQRVAKMAYCLKKRGNVPIVVGENITVSKEFSQYINDIPFVEIPVNEYLKRTPFGKKRQNLIKTVIEKEARHANQLLIIVRDVNYGAIVSKIVKKLSNNKIVFITDVADNYDMLYKSESNPLKKAIFFLGFRYLTRKAFKLSDALIVVTPVNKQRIEKQYSKFMKGKKIFVIRNVPIKFYYLRNRKQSENSFVYVGKIDEISRDPIYIIDKLKDLPDYSLHFYSNEKKTTIDKIRRKAKEYRIEDRIYFHAKVNYDDLSETISQYKYGLVPHKRSPLTDYTVPNKMYDYKSAGLVTIMSDCPSLIMENEEYNFGLIYSKENDDFVEIVRKANDYQLDFNIAIPEWEEEFNKFITEIEHNEICIKEHR